MKKLIQRRVIVQAFAPDGNLVDCLECMHQRRAIADGHGGYCRFETRGCTRCIRIKGDDVTYRKQRMPIDGGALPAKDTRVMTKGVLGSTEAMSIRPDYLAARRKLALGRYLGFVPGHGGDVWWITHDDGTIAAYCYTELTVLRPIERHRLVPTGNSEITRDQSESTLLVFNSTRAPGLTRGELNVVTALPR